MIKKYRCSGTNVRTIFELLDNVDPPIDTTLSGVPVSKASGGLAFFLLTSDSELVLNVESSSLSNSVTFACRLSTKKRRYLMYGGEDTEEQNRTEKSARSDKKGLKHCRLFPP